MMALYHRDLHVGPGQLIDVNLTLVRLLEQTLLGHDQFSPVPERGGFPAVPMVVRAPAAEPR